jgi:hypothetical protein
MVGDYVLVPGNEEIWAENFDWINQTAAQLMVKPSLRISARRRDGSWR